LTAALIIARWVKACGEVAEQHAGGADLLGVEAQAAAGSARGGTALPLNPPTLRTPSRQGFIPVISRSHRLPGAISREAAIG
jgi:hypothetical protein